MIPRSGASDIRRGSLRDKDRLQFHVTRRIDRDVELIGKIPGILGPNVRLWRPSDNPVGEVSSCTTCSLSRARLHGGNFWRVDPGRSAPDPYSAMSARES